MMSRPQLGVAAHDCELGVVELRGLQQDGVRDADLADVVEHAGGAQLLDPLLAQAERGAELGGVAGDGLGVRVRVAVLGVDRAGERVDGVDEAGAQVALGGLLGREREVDSSPE